jgi:hypothetical protein
MKVTLICLVILLASCRSDEKKTEPVNQITAEEETAPISSGSENVTGNFIRFIGMPEKGISNIVQLLMDNDHRFAITTQMIELEDPNDLATVRPASEPTNKATGTWSEVGEQLELKFDIGAPDSVFRNENNKGKIEIIDNRTVRIKKNALKIWIDDILCLR